jgi:hypothetical protein
VLKAESEPWQAWLAHNKVNDPTRYSLQLQSANSRWREWEEAQPWPPAIPIPFPGKQAVGR